MRLFQNKFLGAILPADSKRSKTVLWIRKYLFWIRIRDFRDAN
jgi:hypothetical protein